MRIDTSLWCFRLSETFQRRFHFAYNIPVCDFESIPIDCHEFLSITQSLNNLIGYY